MTIKFNNLTKYNTIIFLDIEYDQNSLVQVAFLILGEKEPNIFELQKSVNFYVKQSHLLSPFFVKYTNITNEFLCDNGIDLARAKTLVDEIIFGVDIFNTLIVSHGIKDDLRILEDNGIDLKQIRNHYCTYKNAKRLLQRDSQLTLKDIAAEGCYYIFDEHNAYADCWATLFAFCYLNELEFGSKE